jgi:glycosyltransferase involved in cell wall biosynthesis
VTKDALPIKVLEYMAASLPIIAQKNTLPHDILIDGENGFFVNNEEDLASKIIDLLENEQRAKKMGLKSREIVSNFDWKIIANKIIDEYKNLKT